MTDQRADRDSDHSTDLDRAQAAVNLAEGDGDAARLAFFCLLADTPLLVLLEREAEGEVLEPRIFTLEEGQVVLAFDQEERLAAMGEGPLPYAELPGRVLARLLASEGLGLGLNLGSGAASEMLLPLTAMRWLEEMLVPQSDVTLDVFGPLSPPKPELVTILTRILDRAPPTWAGLARSVRVFGRGDGGLVVIEGAEPEAETALATAFSEALRFADLGGLVVDLTFAEQRNLPPGGVQVAWPVAAMIAAPQPPSAPGMTKDKPPILR